MLGLRSIRIQLLGARMIYEINVSANNLHLRIITNCGNVYRQCCLSGRQICGYSVDETYIIRSFLVHHKSEVIKHYD
jgi:hypothetical protein